MTNEEYINYKTQEIIKNHQENGRTKEQIKEHVKSGLKAELRVKEILGLNFNSNQVHDIDDPMTFAYDLYDSDGKTYEVKNLKNNSNSGWINLNMKYYKRNNLHYGSYPDISTTMKYKEYIDYIVFYSPDSDVIEYIFKIQDFIDEVRLSKKTLPGMNSTHYMTPNTIKNYKEKN